MALVKVLFDFEGQDAGELSVVAGEIVRVSKMGQMSSDSGWVLVETTKSPLSKGYVPSGYLSEPIQDSQQHKSSPVRSSNNKSFQSPGEPRIRRLSDPRLSGYLEETQDFIDNARVNRSFAPSMIDESRRSPNLPLPLQTSSSPDRYKGAGHTSLVEFRRGQLDFGEEKVSEEDLQRMLQRNDQWHSQVMEARSRKEEGLSAGLNQLKRSLARAREKSQDLASQLGRIETELEHKRNKWQGKLEDRERTAISAHYS